MDMQRRAPEQGPLDTLSHTWLQRTQAVKPKAKFEIEQELAMIAVAQAALLKRINEIEEHYQSGLITHTELVKLTKDAMHRQKHLTERTERIYK